MDCPYCQSNFHPSFTSCGVLIDEYKNKVKYSVYMQLCPVCFKPLIGVEEQASSAFSQGSPINFNKLKLYTPK